MRTRLDKLLVDRGLATSRDRAQRFILAGQVWVAGQRYDKPSSMLPSDAAVEVRGDDIPFVSRGGVKLAGALDHWQIDVRGCVALDIGASTGGFTDCLLQRGARRVIAIDVGYGQFAWSLRNDPRVTLFERSNIRHFDAKDLPDLADLAVIDVSFISLRLVLPALLPLLKRPARVLPMIKPQFEVGKGQVGSGGVVRDSELHAQAIEGVRQSAVALGFVVVGAAVESTLVGPKGNREFFVNLEL